MAFSLISRRPQHGLSTYLPSFLSQVCAGPSFSPLDNIISSIEEITHALPNSPLSPDLEPYDFAVATFEPLSHEQEFPQVTT